MKKISTCSKRILLIIFLTNIISTSYCQQDSNYVKKTPVSGCISSSFGKIGYWDSERQKNTDDFNYVMALSTGIYLGHYYNMSVILNLPMNNEVNKKVPWLSDYYFMLTRSRYTPNTFYWAYSNFANNKYSNSFRQTGQSLKAGNFIFGYIIKIPDSIMRWIKIHPSSKLTTSIQFNYAILYRDKKGDFKGGVFNGKPTINLNLKYHIIHNIFFSGSVYYYLNQDSRLPWDSDYAYGFGFENWKPWKFSFSYSNYTNRFPWETQPANSGFLNGSFMLSFNYAINYRKQIKNY